MGVVIEIWNAQNCWGAQTCSKSLACKEKKVWQPKVGLGFCTVELYLGVALNIITEFWGWRQIKLQAGYVGPHGFNTQYSMSVPLIRVGPPGYFAHIPITTPIVSVLKNYYI
jgi:hypothetical protein